MKEKVKRILDLIRAGKLTPDDAASLLAALHPKLTLGGGDRELVEALLVREDLDTAQVAEHLLLLRGLKGAPPVPPLPPRVPHAPGPPGGAASQAGSQDWNPPHGSDQPGDGRPGNGQRNSQHRGGLEHMMSHLTGTVERAVETALGGLSHLSGADTAGAGHAPRRILTVSVQSSAGDEYTGNFPMSLAPHLHKLIPPHGVRALEQAGFSVETLQLLIEADPPSGDLISAQDSEGNEVEIRIR